MPLCNHSQFVKSLIGMRDLLDFKERKSQKEYRNCDFHMNDWNKKE